MSDLYLRDLTTQDLPFIMDEFEDGASIGSFSKGFSKAGGNKLVERQLRDVIRKGEAGQYTGHYLYVLTRHSNKQKIGYIWLTAAPDMNGQTCLEIRAFGINKAFRGKGYASTLLSDSIESNSHHPMQAKCLAKSKQVADMLLRRGFTVVERTPSGSVLLFKNA
ncbi:GNAT superfamily N-acetyltransferase [Rahnella inusitata]|nr:GNAT superfamily N-acetyltransferase [Rahnella inusitata]